MNKVKAVSQATTAQMVLMKDQALAMGSATKFSAKEAADAQGFLAMAGLSVNDVMAALPGTLELAAAGNLDLATAADKATNVLSGMKLPVEELGRVNDVMAATAGSANTSVLELADAMVYAGPVASSAGITLEETAAAIGVLSNAGMKGEMAGTALRGSISRLLDPSAKAATTMRELGVQTTDSSGAMLPFADILDNIAAAGVDAGEIMGAFGQRAGPGMLNLLATGGDALRGFTVDLEGSGGAAQRMADTQLEGLVGSMTRLSSATDTAKIKAR